MARVPQDLCTYVPSSGNNLLSDVHVACSLIAFKSHPNVTFSMRLSLATTLKIMTP